jgi:beta-mannosidase
MCKGTNWVPLDAIHSRDAERYDDALALLYDSGSNIIRCWGGNVYEDHKLFDFCDRHGIMVWQDFSMACNNYPQKEEFFEKMRREAESVIRELRDHPSLILWSGDNEIDCMMKRVGSQPSKNRITREILPESVYKNDVGRPYLASSPYVSDEVFFNPHLDCPEEHLWGRRDYHKSDFHKNSKYHFVSETGYHGCPNFESIKKFITPEKLWPYNDNSEWILHSSDQAGNPARVMLMEYQVRQTFKKVPSEPEEYILASQITQAEAKKYFIERMRVKRPNKSGIIWWNLLDGWPQMSDAVVDYYFTKKLAYGYIKRSQAPFAIAADEERDGVLPIYACNDTLCERRGHLTVRDAESDGIIFECDFTALINTSTKIAELSANDIDGKMLIFEWSCDDERGYNHYLCQKPPISLEKYKKLMKKYSL